MIDPPIPKFRSENAPPRNFASCRQKFLRCECNKGAPTSALHKQLRLVFTSDIAATPVIVPVPSPAARHICTDVLGEQAITDCPTIIFGICAKIPLFGATSSVRMGGLKKLPPGTATGKHGNYP